MFEDLLKVWGGAFLLVYAWLYCMEAVGSGNSIRPEKEPADVLNRLKGSDG